MNDLGRQAMDVDAFFAWSEEHEGRFELHDGAIVAMSPERYAHLTTKVAVFDALRSAIQSAGVPRRALPDGATVRISKKSAFVPDALVHCGPRPDANAWEIRDPVCVVEVLSPSTLAADHGRKLVGYFSLPSVTHYLIVNPEQRIVIHNKRGFGDALETRILGEGMLKLDPPGLEVLAESLFGLE